MRGTTDRKTRRIEIYGRGKRQTHSGRVEEEKVDISCPKFLSFSNMKKLTKYLKNLHKSYFINLTNDLEILYRWLRDL